MMMTRRRKKQIYAAIPWMIGLLLLAIALMPKMYGDPIQQIICGIDPASDGC